MKRHGTQQCLFAFLENNAKIPRVLWLYFESNFLKPGNINLFKTRFPITLKPVNYMIETLALIHFSPVLHYI